MTTHGITLGVIVLTLATAASAGWVLLTHEPPDRAATSDPALPPPATKAPAAKAPALASAAEPSAEIPVVRLPASLAGAPEQMADHEAEPAGGGRIAAAPAATRLNVSASSDMAATASPVLDLVRIEPDGAGLIAGRATAGGEVEIIVERDVVGRATAGPDGAFVAFFNVDPSQGAQEIAARAAAGAGALHASSGSAYVIAAAAPEEAPVVVRPGESGLSVVQSPARSPATGVTLDVISYDDEGRLVLSGRSGEGVEIRAFLGDDRLARVDVAQDGAWRLRPDRAVAPGVYRLRLEEIGAGGRVLTRLATSFKREAKSSGALSPGGLTVQRGDNLWRIAEQRYGAGARYTIIYRANRGAIEDPDLIYPGQVFDIPAAR